VADVQIAVALRESAPFGYEVPNSQEIVPKCVNAIVDGSAAASSFVPVVEIISDGGIVVARCPAPTVAAGGSANVSWFPGGSVLGGGGGLQRLIGARIQATSTQSVLDSANTNLVYQSVLFDTDGMANLASDNRILTVHTAGLYLVVCQTDWAPNGAGRRINTALHNAYYTDGSIPAVDSQSDERPAVWNPVSANLGRTSNTSTGVYRASVGDFFSSGAYQGSGAALNANGFANCFLSAMLIGV